MSSILLSRARDYETEHLFDVPPAHLPRFHVTGGVGWINDPNGFSLYRDEYHLFFQYNPYDVYWDTMHWGHVKTRDFIRWERLPCALAPDKSYDEFGCFSGSAVELRDGRHLLMYTGVAKADDGEDRQTQCIAFGDGINYEKYKANCSYGRHSQFICKSGNHSGFTAARRKPRPFSGSEDSKGRR